MNSIIPREY